MTGPTEGPAPVTIEQCYPPSFYAALLQVSVHDRARVSGPEGRDPARGRASKNGKRTEGRAANSLPNI